MGSILIEKGTVVTVDDAGQVFDPGYVFVEEDRISAVGKGPSPPALRAQADTMIDATFMAIMPGMINAHTHLFQTFIRGLADDKPLLDWRWSGSHPAWHLRNPGILQVWRIGGSQTVPRRS